MEHSIFELQDSAKDALALIAVLAGFVLTVVLLKDRSNAPDFSLAEMDESRITRLVEMAGLPEQRVRLILANIVGKDARGIMRLNDEHVVAFVLDHPLAQSTIGAEAT